MPDSPYSLRNQILILLTVLVVSTPLFVSRAQLRLPLAPAELEVLLASESLLADRDLWLEHEDQTRISRQWLDTLGPLTPRPIELKQPVYSVVAGPLAVLWGDAGMVLLNAAVFAMLLWSFCDPRSPEEGRFWWGLSYLMVCCYPVLVWRLDEAVVLGAILYLAVSPWGDRNPRASGAMVGALLPGHIWLVPFAVALGWTRPWRFRIPVVMTALLLGGGARLALPQPAEPSHAEAGRETGVPEPARTPGPGMRQVPDEGSVPGEPAESGTGQAADGGSVPNPSAPGSAPTSSIFPLAPAPPESLAAALTKPLEMERRPLALGPWFAMSGVVLFLFGRLQGILPYFLPWAVGLFRYVGYERRRREKLLIAGLLGSLVWSGASLPNETIGPAQPGLALLLPTFFLFSRPVTQLTGLVALWGVSSLFTAVLFLNPIHSASHPSDTLTLWPHRELPLEIGRLDPALVPVAEIPGSRGLAFFPGRNAWAGPDGRIRVRGKQWGHIALRLPAGARAPELLVRAPVDLEVTIEVSGARARFEMSQGVPVRIAIPAELIGGCGDGLGCAEVRIWPSSGLVPRLQADGGNGVDYVGVELWVL